MPEADLKKDSGAGDFLGICAISKNTFSQRTPPVAASEVKRSEDANDLVCMKSTYAFVKCKPNNNKNYRSDFYKYLIQSIYSANNFHRTFTIYKQ